MLNRNRVVGVLLAGWMWIAALGATPALGWSQNGHMIIGAITYRTLSPADQVRYTEMLKQHPHFIFWEVQYNEMDVELELGEFLFMKASTWPDAIRRKGNPHDHPTWHYTNFPLIPNDFPMKPTLTPENDVLFAIEKSRQVLADESASLQEKAVYLSWLLHTVGDLHQPLHSVAYVNDLFPEGDRGGNLFYVRPRESSKGVNLHRYWDSLLGTDGKVRRVRNDATKLWAELGQEITGNIVSDPLDATQWALEGREIAIQYVYLQGQIEPTLEEQRAQATILPESYGENARAVAKKRVVAAALRITKVLS